MRTSKKKHNINKKLSLKKEHHKKKSKNKIFKINGGVITDNESKLNYILDLAKKSVENDSENLYSLLITDKFIDIIRVKYSDSIIADMQKILITQNYQEFNKYYDKTISDKVNNLFDSVKEEIVKSVFHNNDDLNSYLKKTGLNYEIGIKFLWLGLIFCILKTNIHWGNINKDTDLNKLIVKHTKKLSINKFGGSPPSNLNVGEQRVYNDIVNQLKTVVNNSLLSTLSILHNIDSSYVSQFNIHDIESHFSAIKTCFTNTKKESKESSFETNRKYQILGLHEDQILLFYQGLIADVRGKETYASLEKSHIKIQDDINRNERQLALYHRTNTWGIDNGYRDTLISYFFIGCLISMPIGIVFGRELALFSEFLIVVLLSAINYRDGPRFDSTSLPSPVEPLQKQLDEIIGKMETLKRYKLEYISRIQDFILDQQIYFLEHLNDELNKQLDETKQKFVSQFDNLKKNIERKTIWIDRVLLEINLDLRDILFDNIELLELCKDKFSKAKYQQGGRPGYFIDKSEWIHQIDQLHKEYIQLLENLKPEELVTLHNNEDQYRKWFIQKCVIKQVNFKEHKKAAKEEFTTKRISNISQIVLLFDNKIKDLAKLTDETNKISSINVETHDEIKKIFFVTDTWRLNELKKIFKAVETAIFNGSDEKFLHYKLKYILRSAEGNDPTSRERVNQTFNHKYKKLGFNDPLQFLENCDMNPIIFNSIVEQRISRVNTLYERFKGTILLYIIEETVDKFDTSNAVELIYYKVNISFETLNKISRLNQSDPDLFRLLNQDAISETEKWLKEIAKRFPMQISATEINLVIHKLGNYFYNNIPFITDLLQNDITKYTHVKKQLLLLKQIGDTYNLEDRILIDLMHQLNNNADRVNERIEYENTLMREGVPTREAAEKILVENNGDFKKALEHINRFGLIAQPQTPLLANAANAQFQAANRHVVDFLNN
jgi:hypothetical protein